MKCFCFGLTAAAVALLTVVSNADAASVTSGIGPDSTAPVFTVDPDTNRDAAPASRGIAFDRNVRQTFVYNGTDRLLVDDIRVSVNLNGAEGTEQLGGLELRVYQSWDPNNSALSLAGGPLVDIVVADAATGILDNGDGLQVLLDTNDPNEQLVLVPGLAYALELSNNDDTTNFAAWRHTNNSTGGPGGGVLDLYVDGKFYTESGGQSGAGHRDAGLSMNGTTYVPEPTSLALLVGCCSLMALRRQ